MHGMGTILSPVKEITKYKKKHLKRIILESNRNVSFGFNIRQAGFFKQNHKIDLYIMAKKHCINLKKKLAMGN
jgi:hypothetical protein